MSGPTPVAGPTKSALDRSSIGLALVVSLCPAQNASNGVIMLDTASQDLRIRANASVTTPSHRLARLTRASATCPASLTLARCAEDQHCFPSSQSRTALHLPAKCEDTSTSTGGTTATRPSEERNFDRSKIILAACRRGHVFSSSLLDVLYLNRVSRFAISLTDVLETWDG